MKSVRAKKSFGQHFLKNESIAHQIVEALQPELKRLSIIEIGPGMGVLTKYLIHLNNALKVVELDRESIAFLKDNYQNKLEIIEGDFLKLAAENLIQVPTAIIGNFPYNISTQIIFQTIYNRNQVALLVGMFQKEVAKRLCSAPCNKEYGILSVYLQTFYECSYLFTVEPGSFQPPPKVNSGVIKAVRKENYELPCDETLYLRLIKMAFNQRRKTLRNALKQLMVEKNISSFENENKRAEQLHFTEFIELCFLFENR